ncbi:MAG: gas vesicle protein [Halanaerobiales bacterium]|nr:gas vesicle protein [Halanaerobiales bacterium]
MKIKEIKDKILDFADEILGESVRIVGVNNIEAGWGVTVEAIEEKQYARKYARDELIGIYKIKLDQKLEVTGWERSGFRKRGTV